MSEKLNNKVGVDTAKCPKKIEHGDLLLNAAKTPTSTIRCREIRSNKEMGY